MAGPGSSSPPRTRPRSPAALDELAVDPALRRRMGDAAHARVRSSFSADDMVERTLAVYADLAARRSG